MKQKTTDCSVNCINRSPLVANRRWSSFEAYTCHTQSAGVAGQPAFCVELLQFCNVSYKNKLHVLVCYFEADIAFELGIAKPVWCCATSSEHAV